MEPIPTLPGEWGVHPRPLTDYDRQILAALEGDGGFLTGDIADKINPMFGTNKRQHSGAVRSWLLLLESEGRVRRLDDQKPVCWEIVR